MVACLCFEEVYDIPPLIASAIADRILQLAGLNEKLFVFGEFTLVVIALENQ